MDDGVYCFSYFEGNDIMCSYFSILCSYFYHSFSCGCRGVTLELLRLSSLPSCPPTGSGGALIDLLVRGFEGCCKALWPKLALLMLLFGAVVTESDDTCLATVEGS